MGANNSRRIRDKIEQYATDPMSLANNIKRLKGREGLRLRIGDWRVIFDETRDTVIIVAVGHRREVYD